MTGLRCAVLVAVLLLAGCGNGAGNVPGSAEDRQPFAGITEDDVLRFTGTEPFWGGRVTGERLTWSTPENIDGTSIDVERFAGRGGLSFAGDLDGRRLVLAVTPGECSDGMSDRAYPYVATVSLGSQVLEGCAWREQDNEPDHMPGT